MNNSNSIKNQTLFCSSTIFDNHRNLFKILEHQKPTLYDKIMDKVYLETRIGGGTHRHFDGSHTFLSSYEKIKTKTGSVDLFDYFKSHFNEFVTPEGVPIFNLNRENHIKISHEISDGTGNIVSPGQIREFIRDMNSVNACKIAAASIGAIFLISAIKSGDSKAISRVVSANLCLGMVSGNPVQLILGMAGLAYGIYNGKIKTYEILLGALPIGAGFIGHQTGKHIFGLSKNGSIIFAIGTSICSEVIINYLDAQKQEKIITELSDTKDDKIYLPKYITSLTPAVIKTEFELLSRKNPTLAIHI